ncbi:hypothetical protein PM082_024666 [Marasmius tenuissimus]|nr:hypothetical protein PM082_024666 [Marasmius tenuissimus]
MSSGYRVLPPPDYDYSPEIVSDMECAGRKKPPYPFNGPGEPPRLPEQPVFKNDTRRSRNVSIDSHLEEVRQYGIALQTWKDQLEEYSEERRKFLHWHKRYLQWKRAVESEGDDESEEEDDQEMPVKSKKGLTGRKVSSKHKSEIDTDVEFNAIQTSSRLRTTTKESISEKIPRRASLGSSGSKMTRTAKEYVRGEPREGQEHG